MAAGLLFIGIALAVCSTVVLIIALNAMKRKEDKYDEQIKKIMGEIDEESKR